MTPFFAMPTLPENATMLQMVEAIWRLPRNLVSDGYDTALWALARQIPMNVHEYPTGTPCFTWTVPEKWNCREARLETLSGRVLFSSLDNPLHIASYSIPFCGELSREELLAKIHVHPKIFDAVPFKFFYYTRDWGLCCSQNLKNTLDEPHYRVLIDAEFSSGTLKVGEVVLHGETEDCFVFCAHLCHPAMVNDDLSGVVVGIDVMRQLAKLPKRHYTYRMVILPETVGSAAFLSHNEALIPTMRGGLFLEMLGTGHPHVLQKSLAGNSLIDRCVALALRDLGQEHRVEDFRSVILNDERMFNAPGICVPMASLCRVLPTSHPDYPYAEYHTNLDCPERMSVTSLEASRDLVLDVVNMLEYDHIPIPKFKGELCFSRYGFDYDRLKLHLLDIIFCLNGETSASRIAEKTGAPFPLVKDCLDHMESHNLIQKVVLPREKDSR